MARSKKRQGSTSRDGGTTRKVGGRAQNGSGTGKRRKSGEAAPGSVDQHGTASRPLVVGIGASAGGLTALHELFAAIPQSSGVAWVVILHIPAEHHSYLAEVLQPAVNLPVVLVDDAMELQADNIYVIPPGTDLAVAEGKVRPEPMHRTRKVRAPIDYFLRTLASECGTRSAAVILSGTGGDGAQGVRYIREAGGLTVAQDPAGAEFDSMPRSAIQTGCVDLVLPAARVFEHVLEFSRTRPRVPQARSALAGESDKDSLQTMLAFVRATTGQDFLRYKRSTIARRVARRMQILHIEDVDDYLKLLRQDPVESASLVDDLLINVTSFFRDPDVFKVLETSVIPSLFEGKTRADSVRIWSVGCATGEEAYSLGILLLEQASQRAVAPQLQIFATDLHERSLQTGREALYPEGIVNEITAERLDRFFRHESGGYRISKELRDVVVFAAHNLLRDPPFSKIDLVVCRNVLIYLNRDVQDEVINVFHYALRHGGYLLLGTAETFERSDLFSVVDKPAHLYRRRDVRTLPPRLPQPSGPVRGLQASTAEGPQRRVPADGYGALHQRMVERYAPPSLLITAEHEVVHVSDHAGRYLQYPGGEPTRDIFKLVREEFRMELRAALHSARTRKEVWRSRPIQVALDGEMRAVVLRVSPADAPHVEGLALVIFDEGPPAQPESASTVSIEIDELEAELDLTRSRLQAVIEEFETGQEEMRASNEELQSSNEELRSTMEELETSREELQSVNEELQTLNQEYKHKVDELSQLTSDLQNLLQATDVATVFLDRHLRIVRFTPRAIEIFNVRYSDRGRPLGDFTHELGYATLIDDARKVLHTLIPLEREIPGTAADSWYVLRISPYRTMDDRIEGVVITILDVTALKRTQAQLRELNDTLERRVQERTEALEAMNASRNVALRKLVTAEDTERRRISRELHDSLGQLVAALIVGLHMLEQDPAPSARIADLKELADRIAREIQHLALELRPAVLADHGLQLALEAHLQDWSKRHGIESTFHSVSNDGSELRPEVEITLYRVVQEALTNVVKHAQATHVGIMVEQRNGSARVIVEDNGNGFDVEPALRDGFQQRRLGLLGMRERIILVGGDLQIESAPGGGTTIIARVGGAAESS